MAIILEKPVDTPVPVIDFSLFRRAASPEQRKATAEAIVSAFRTVGCVYLVNHGIPLSQADECFHWSKAFFELPIAEKTKCPRIHSSNGSYHVGYFGGKQQNVQQSLGRPGIAHLRTGLDVKEVFEMHRDDDPKCANQWPQPSALPGFREFLVKFFWTCREAQMEILHAIALGLGIEETYFDEYHADAVNQLRLLHYPPVEESALQSGENERITSHTDVRCLTMLLQDQCGGLEIEDPEAPGTFKPVPPVDGTLIVNIGDLLMRWSNGVLKSPVHRVNAPHNTSTRSNGEIQKARMTPPRYSIPYFVTTDRNAIIDCLPGCWSDEIPKKFERITTSKYVETLSAPAKY